MHRHAVLREAKEGPCHWTFRVIRSFQLRNRQDVRLIYPPTWGQQDGIAHQHGASNKQEAMMFTKCMIALGAAVVLTATFGSTAIAQTNSRDWWRAHQPNVENGQVAAPNRCIRGEESASSAYPSRMHC